MGAIAALASAALVCATAPAQFTIIPENGDFEKGPPPSSRGLSRGASSIPRSRRRRSERSPSAGPSPILLRPRRARGRGRCAPQIRAGTSEATREGALPGSAQGARNTLRRHGPGRPHVLGSGIVEGHVVRAKTRWAADRVIDYWLRRLGRAVRCKQSL